MKKVRSSPLKYADKSAGQPDLQSLFVQLKKILSAFSGGNYIVKTDQPGAYEIYYGNEVERLGVRYPELSFAGLIIQKGYVGFYFFPVYVEGSLLEKLAPALQKCLKGKTCFHIKKADLEILENIKEALASGYQLYASRGWTK